MTTTSNVPVRSILAEVKRAAEAAVKACVPTPMIVGTPTTPFGNDLDTSKQVYYVAGGVCGFAGVVVRPARGKFVTYCKKYGLGYKHYYGGWYVSSWEFAPGLRYEQSYEKNCAAAYAACKVLASHGLSVTVDSRLD